MDAEALMPGRYALPGTRAGARHAAPAATPSPLHELRADFERRTHRSMSMPIAGLVVWIAIGVAGWTLPPKAALLFMLCATGAIFPLALVIARVRHEALVSNQNPLAKLMGSCIFMVNLLWAVHIPLLIGDAAYVPLSLGIALGLHWVVYSWIVQHKVGIVHAVVRTAAVLSAWLLFPGERIAAVAVAIVIAYALALAMMQTRSVMGGAA